MPQSSVSVQDFLAKWPAPIVCRMEAGKATGGLISPKQLANLDCEGHGPPEALRLGADQRGKVAYPAKSFFEWVCSQLKPVERRTRPVGGAQ